MFVSCRTLVCRPMRNTGATHWGCSHFNDLSCESTKIPRSQSVAPGEESLAFLVVLFADCLCSVQIVIDIPRLNAEPVCNLAD